MVVFTMNSISIRMKCVFLVLLLHLSVGSRWVALDQCHDLMKPVPALNFELRVESTDCTEPATEFAEAARHEQKRSQKILGTEVLGTLDGFSMHSQLC
jgi:hypothetical protein